MYAIGQGTPQYYKQAYIWFSLASISDEKYKEARDRAAAHLSPTQLSEGQAEASILYKKIEATKK